MPAGWGSGNKSELQPGRYVAQIRDVSRAEGTDFNDKSKKIEQFKWECDVQLQGGDGRWTPHTIYTKCAFADMAQIKDPQFVPKLNRLVRACGVKLPTTAEEAQAWDENAMIGLRFGVLVQPDPEDPNTVSTKYVQLPAGQAGTQPPAREEREKAKEQEEAAGAGAPRELVGAATGGTDDEWKTP